MPTDLPTPARLAAICAAVSPAGHAYAAACKASSDFDEAFKYRPWNDADDRHSRKLGCAATILHRDCTPADLVRLRYLNMVDWYQQETRIGWADRADTHEKWLGALERIGAALEAVETSERVLAETRARAA